MNVKFGVILSVYNGIDYLEKCLDPWIKRRAYNLDILISCVDAKFKDFEGHPHSTDGTIELLEKYKKDNKIDYFQFLRPDLTEHEARNAAVNPLLKTDCTHIFSLGVDEIYQEQEIDNIIRFVEKRDFVNVFYINFKNLFKTECQYIDGFCPRRIWRIENADYKFKEMIYDDDAVFLDKKNNKLVKDTDVSNLIIPRNVAHVRHFTWLDDERSRQKIYYQKSRWGDDGCSYDWVDGHLCLNEAFYKKTGLPKPEILKV